MCKAIIVDLKLKQRVSNGLGFLFWVVIHLVKIYITKKLLNYSCIQYFV